MKHSRSILLALILAALPAATPGEPASAAGRPVAPTDYTQNLHQLGYSENKGGPTFNSDLAFWGRYAYQGNFEGFRILDVSAPANPKVVVDFADCVGGAFSGGQGDLVVWENLLVRTWDSPAPAGGLACGNLFTPEGQEGLHIFDISNPRSPVGVAFVPVTGGSHTATAVPDPDNGRLLVYNSASNPGRPGIDIVSIPLDDPASASVIDFRPAGRPCHDVGVILGEALLAACAGGDGLTVWSLDPADGGSLDHPAFLYQRTVSGVTIGHSATFTWDGSTIVFGHEPGGGVSPNCQTTNPDVDKTLFFFDARTGVEVGRWLLPRPQTATENCTLHNYNVVPTDRGNILVMGNYQSGISVVDFTDPANAVEIAYADPAPLDPPALGGDWSTYWYDGFIYESDITRGLQVWNLSDAAVAGARKLGRLNPQTQEMTIPLRDPAPRDLTGSFRLVGHDPLFGRGMNAALAIHGDYAYIGNRTDGDITGICLVVCAEHAGLLIVDISDPTNPFVAAEVGPPLEGNDQESSRELRVWAEQDILIVLHTNCGGNGAHNCEGASLNGWRFYDISGEFATNPQLIATLSSAHNTHEFFLWQDPSNPERALMYGGSAGSGTGSLRVWDLSPLLEGLPPTRPGNTSHGFSSAPGKPTGSLHSLSISNDGNTAYYALLTGGFGTADVSDFALGLENPQRRIITTNANRPIWPGPGAHSAVKFWGRDYVWMTDEVYGTATGSGHGCPWGWARVVDNSDPLTPVVVSEYREPQNYAFQCSDWEPRPRTAFSAHNPTLTPNIAFTSWHSNGLQATSLADPFYPYQLAEFMPEPVETIVMEDPRLSNDVDTGIGEKVVMWSYPIIKDGLIYVVDLRNGLYILEYDGPFEDEVNSVTFLEGNSNLGHALCFEPVGPAPAYCD